MSLDITPLRGEVWDAHVALGPDAGLIEHHESYAVATELHQVALAACRRRRGRLSPSEMRSLEQAIRTAHGLLE